MSGLVSKTSCNSPLQRTRSAPYLVQPHAVSEINPRFLRQSLADLKRLVTFNNYVKPVFLAGILIRLFLMALTTHAGTWENVNAIAVAFNYGLNPMLWTVSLGPGFYAIYLPVYVPYTILNLLGIYGSIFLVFLFKLPTLAGDVLVFYALYKIAMLVSDNREKALALGFAFFLNPYVIWMSSAVGHFEQLVAGFMLLSFFFALRAKAGPSGLCLGFATSCQPIALLLFPFMIAETVQTARVRQLRGLSTGAVIGRFLCGFTLPMLPYVIVGGVLFFFSPEALRLFLSLRLGPIESAIPSQPTTFPGGFYNLSGVFNQLGASPVLIPYLNYRTFLAVYAITTAAAILSWRRTWDADSTVRVSALIFIIFVLVIPLSQHHYLLWFLPFLFLEAILFNSIPLYYVHLIWIANVLIDPIAGYNFVWYFDITMPWLFRYRPQGDLFLQLSASTLHSMLLVLAALFLIFGRVRLCSLAMRRQSMTTSFATSVISAGLLVGLILLSRGYPHSNFFMVSLVSMILLGSSLLLDPARSKTSMARGSLLVSSVLFTYPLLATKDISLLLLALPFSVSWLYLEALLSIRLLPEGRL